MPLATLFTIKAFKIERSLRLVHKGQRRRQRCHCHCEWVAHSLMTTATSSEMGCKDVNESIHIGYDYSLIPSSRASVP